jgi:hypothetical protein
MRIIALPITTAADGTATVQQSENAVNGFLVEVIYVPGTLDTGADLTISIANSKVTKTLLTLTDAGTSTLTRYPRGSACGATGTVGTDGMQYIPVIGQFKVVVAQGGNAGVGALYFTVLEDLK